MAICKSSPPELDDPELHGSDGSGTANSENDMWSLMRPELRSVSDAFGSLLSANGGRCQWEKTKQSLFFRNSSANRFQLCTEGLGCESCDGLTDSDESSSTFSCSSPSVGEGGDVLADEEDDADDDDIEGSEDLRISGECNLLAKQVADTEDGGDPPICQESKFSAEEDDNYVQMIGNASSNFRKFPPPLPSISRGNASSVFMRSYKKDGRFVLQAVKVRSTKYLQAFREGGRLKMQLIRTKEELPEIRSPEGDAGRDSDKTNDDPVDDDDGLSPDPESCSDCHDLAVGKPGAEFAPPNDRKADFLSREYFFDTFECFARKNYLSIMNSGISFNSDCENVDYGGGSKPEHVSAKSRGNLRVASGGLNVYKGWRTASHRTPEFCHETQTLQKPPSPSALLLRYPLRVHRCAGFDTERRSHSLPKYRSHCMATST